MNLLFEYAIRAFDPDDAHHVDADGSDVDADGSDVDADGADAPSIEPLVSTAPNRHRFLAHPDHDDWLCIPLHELDSAALTDEYVVYEDHPIRGDVFVVRTADGDPEPVPADEFGATELGRRIRFWLPGFEPDSLPDYAHHPVGRESPNVSEDPDAFFDRLAAFVEAEREGDRDRNRERAAERTPRGRHHDGDSAIPEVGGYSRTDEARFRFHVLAENTHGDVKDRFGIYEDNEVLVHSNDPGSAPDGLPVEATVDRIADFTIDLVAHGDPEAAADALEAADSLGVSLLLNDLPTSREQEAVDAARADEETRTLLAGQRDATFDHDAGRRVAPRDPDLNRRQELAATCALYADDAFCIHGPPGTGKTRTLVEVVRRAVSAGERVLACADSNQAVDNFLIGSSAEGHPDEGSLHYYAETEDEFTLNRHRADHSDEEFVVDHYDRRVPSADVVATTNNSAAQLDADFDLVVIDEATQATMQSTLIPAMKGDRLVLAGDHKQLPPFDARTTPDDDRHRSLFEHLYAEDGGERTEGESEQSESERRQTTSTGRSRSSSDPRSDGVYGHRLGTMLTTQYRMADHIARFSDRQFYDGELRDGREVTAIDGLPTLVRADVDGPERIDDAHSHYNPSEAERVAELVDRLLDAGVQQEDVGVITPYEAQVHAVRDELDRHVEVDTIDSFQGGEREAIVVSFVRSNDDGDVGFLGRPEDGPRRLNVALTRAERFLGLVADWDTLTDGGSNESVDLYRALDEYVDKRATDSVET